METPRPGEPSPWQGHVPGDAAETALTVVWSVEPEPIDAGVPPRLALFLAEWLTRSGWLAFPIGGKPRRVTWASTRSAGEGMEMFEAPAFPWWLGGQGALLFDGPPPERYLSQPCFQRLMGDDWAQLAGEDCRAVLRAGIDGDALCIRFAHGADRQAALADLRGLAQRAGFICTGK